MFILSAGPSAALSYCGRAAANLTARLFKETEIADLRHRKRLRDLGIFAHQVDHELQPFRLDRHVTQNAAIELPQHLAGELSIGEPPLLHDDIHHFLAVARLGD